MNDIRVLNAKNRQELLRIQVPNLECNCVVFMNDGKSILSGWNDGKIRSFYPQSGKLMYLINDAHIHGVTAITTTNDCQRYEKFLIISFVLSFKFLFNFLIPFFGDLFWHIFYNFQWLFFCSLFYRFSISLMIICFTDF